MPVDLASLRLRPADVARALGVQRPVISAWRSRYARAAVPFPSSEIVTAAELLAWLSATGRDRDGGEAALALHGDLAVPGLTVKQVRDGVEALLVLARATGAHLGGLGPAGLVSLADDIDPDDDYLLSEITALGQNARQVAGFVTLMLDAVDSPGSALEVRRSRSGGGTPSGDETPAKATQIDAAAVSLVARVALALAEWGPDEDVALTDAFPGVGELAAGVPGVVGGWDTAQLAIPFQGAVPAARALRRRLVVHGWQLTEGESSGRLVIADLTSLREPGQALSRADEIALAMRPGSRAVILGSAGALIDELAQSSDDRIRTDLLRTGRVRAMFRLAAGLLPSRPREVAALWVLGDPMDGTPIEERWTTVADLSRFAAAGGVIPNAVADDLITDVLAAVEGNEAAKRHGFAHARVVRTRVLITARGDLVNQADRGKYASQASSPSRAIDVADLLRASGAQEREPLALAVSPQEATPVALLALEDLIRAGRIRMIPGSRVPSTVGSSRASGVSQGLRVVTAADVVAGSLSVGRCTDAVEVAREVPRAHLSEPGDVVVTASPRPAAVVDAEGGCLVVTPARILRPVRPSKGGVGARELSGHLAAAAINARPVGDRRWRRWLVPVLDSASAYSAEKALALVDERAREAQETLERLEALRHGLIQGMSEGSLKISVFTNSVHSEEPAFEKHELVGIEEGNEHGTQE